MNRSPITRATPACLAAALALLTSAGDGHAQEEESAYVYASYYQCGPGLGEAVATMRDDWAPIMKGHVDAGHVTNWGVLTHDTGNRWSMAIYHIGPDRNALMTALDESLAAYFERHPEAGARFGEACPTHEDYIWVREAGSQSAAELARSRPAAAQSVYWVCDEGREAVADLIVEKVWAPVLDRLVTEGRINSWGWLSHFIGGEYRRLLTTDGADHAALLDARDTMIEATASEDAALAAAFSDVCNGHTDVMWNVAVSGS